MNGTVLFYSLISLGVFMRDALSDPHKGFEATAMWFVGIAFAYFAKVSWTK